MRKIIITESQYKLINESLLQEAKSVGVLYHFTTLHALIGIIQSDFHLKTGAGYISTTRKKASIGFPDYKEQVRLTLDGNNLSNKYKIEPYSDQVYNKRNWRSVYMTNSRYVDASEAEERIYSGDVDIKNSIINVSISEPDVEFQKRILPFLEKNNIQYQIVDKHK